MTYADDVTRPLFEDLYWEVTAALGECSEGAECSDVQSSIRAKARAVENAACASLVNATARKRRALIAWLRLRTVRQGR